MGLGGLALLLNSPKLIGRNIFRPLFYMPIQIPLVASTLVWIGFLNTETGWLNAILGAFGLPGPDWINSETWIYPALALIGLWGLVTHPRRFRFNAMARQFEVVGVTALGIIGLMSFLVGIVIAQQGAVQLRQFGAEVYTINLIGRITVRELGVLMTAIMVAGRSGSALAAQIGTMKITANSFLAIGSP